MASLPIQTVAVPWFKDWEQLKYTQDVVGITSAAQLDYDEWLYFATMTEDHIRTVLGVTPIRVPIEVAKWTTWCDENKIETNMASIRRYAEAHKDNQSEDLGPWHDLFPRSKYQGS